jgi:hypothetical protein
MFGHVWTTEKVIRREARAPSWILDTMMLLFHRVGDDIKDARFEKITF